MGYEAISSIITPETVSLQISISDSYIFTQQRKNVHHIIELEKPKGVIVHFGGQTAINLAEKLKLCRNLGLSRRFRQSRKQINLNMHCELGIPQTIG